MIRPSCCWAHPAQGKDLSARLVGKLATGMATDCTDVKIADGKLLAIRPMYAGKCFGEVVFTAPPQMASLRPNVFPIVENAKAGAVVKFDAGLGCGAAEDQSPRSAEGSGAARSM